MTRRKAAPTTSAREDCETTEGAFQGFVVAIGASAGGLEAL